MSWKARLPVLAAALWWGSLSVVGAIVVPMLFRHAGSPRMAGQIAARIFEAQVWLGVACGMVLLMSARGEDGRPTLGWARGALVFVVLGMLFALLQELAVAPRILARQDLGLWHPIGSGLFAGQWACALTVLWKLAGRTP